MSTDPMADLQASPEQVAQRRAAAELRQRMLETAFTPAERALIELHEFIPELDAGYYGDDGQTLFRWSSYHTHSEATVKLVQRRYELLGLVS